ncbi:MULTISPECIES: DUF488 family protein [Microbacterium]|uniref:DUF488 domain-containing protein n=1 Tax=Microbacterium commune TaxID=2762219 RepID=A0ABR8W1K2_9MICO|nr:MULTISPECIES: DUF488 domain-containing protein [Microbacterium]MBD8010895.1 DUF488 domain-containing protein [Microbacterium commune]OIU88378.1 DNA repair protein [Microbacterium sp. AR7-10]
MILTVGHSTHPLEEFTGLLRAADVGAVIDVRRLPGSNRYPWFNADALAASLPEQDIRYLRIEQLGGRRNLQRDVPDEVNGMWRNRSFHNYADYALSGEFAEGVDELLAVAEDVAGAAAVMCSEAVWWRCHRRIIADHLLARGVAVGHLMPDGRVAEATLTPGAEPRDGTVEYPVAG